MYLKIQFILIFVIASFIGFGQIDNNIVVRQSGESLELIIEQVGENNVIGVGQSGIGHNAGVYQDGGDNNNVKLVQEEGSNNSGVVFQNGSRNIVEGLQSEGSYNTMEITQDGNDNITTGSQNGTTSSDNMVTVNQLGTVNSLSFSQSGYASALYIGQSGTNNVIGSEPETGAVQGGMNNIASIIQSGDQNTISRFFQAGEDLNAEINQSGTNNNISTDIPTQSAPSAGTGTIFVVNSVVDLSGNLGGGEQVGNLSSLTINQSGTNGLIGFRQGGDEHTLNLGQKGDGNTLGIIQSGTMNTAFLNQSENTLNSILTASQSGSLNSMIITQ